MTALFFSSFAVAFSGAIMPGPLLSFTVTESTRKGFITGPLVILGHAVLELLLIAAILFGLAPVLNNNLFFSVVSFVGGGILVWLGIGMVRSIPSLKVEWERKGGTSSRAVIRGIILSLANPYWIVWWATIGLGYILQAKAFGITGIALFYIGHILADLVWYSLVSWTISKGRKLFTDKVYKWLVGVCSGIMIGFAGYFVFRGISAFPF